MSNLAHKKKIFYIHWEEPLDVTFSSMFILIDKTGMNRDEKEKDSAHIDWRMQ